LRGTVSLNDSDRESVEPLENERKYSLKKQHLVKQQTVTNQFWTDPKNMAFCER